jgi:hypothetical protein
MMMHKMFVDVHFVYRWGYRGARDNPSERSCPAQPMQHQVWQSALTIFPLTARIS